MYSVQLWFAGDMNGKYSFSAQATGAFARDVDIRPSTRYLNGSKR